MVYHWSQLVDPKAKDWIDWRIWQFCTHYLSKGWVTGGGACLLFCTHIPTNNLKLIWESLSTLWINTSIWLQYWTTKCSMNMEGACLLKCFVITITLVRFVPFRKNEKMIGCTDFGISIGLITFIEMCFGSLQTRDRSIFSGWQAQRNCKHMSGSPKQFYTCCRQYNAGGVLQLMYSMFFVLLNDLFNLDSTPV